LQNSPFIHLFNVANKYCFYDVNKNNVLEISKEVYDYLLNSDTSNENVLSEIKSLKNRGYLSTKRITKIEHPMTPLISNYLDNKMQMITLQVTQNCNLRCKYCVYGGDYKTRQHSNKTMTLEIAKKAVDFFIAHSSESDRVGIAFYGGEPLLNFNVIRETVLYLINEYPGKQYYFTITTNGTVFNDENLKFMNEFKFGIMISLDGDKQTHNANRRFKNNDQGSFDTVIKNIQYIKEHYPKLNELMAFSVVLSLSSYFSGCNDFFTKLNPGEEHNLVVSTVSNRYKENCEADAVKNINEENILYQRYEIFKCILISIGRLEEKHVSNMIKRFYAQIKESYDKLYITQNGVQDIEHPAGSCIPGVFKLFINADGDFYPCEKVSEESKSARLGDLDHGFNLQNIESGLNVGKIGEDLCNNCWAYRYCKLCLMVVDDIDKLSVRKKVQFCKTIKQEVDMMMREYVFINQFRNIEND